MKKKTPVIVPFLVALAALLVLAPVVHAAGASFSASASVNVKLTPDPTGMFLVGAPPVPIVRPHRITLGLLSGGVVRTRVFGLSPSRVVYVGARARPFVLVGAPVVVAAPGAAVIGAPGVVVQQPGVVVQQPGVVVGAGVVVQQPAVVVGAPAVVVGVPGVVVQKPGVIVVGPGKHDNGHHKGHFKGKGRR